MADGSSKARRRALGLVLIGVCALIAAWLLRGSVTPARVAPTSPIPARGDAQGRLRGESGSQPGRDGASPPIVVTNSGAVVEDRTTHGVRDLPDPILPGTEFSLKGVTAATGAALGTAMLPVVAQCGREVPAAARGPHPMVQPAFVVQVAGGQLTVTDVSFSTRDIDASARAGFTACMRRGAIGATIPAPGEADLDRYLIHIPMRLPK